MPVERPWSDDRAFLGWADGPGAYVIANQLQVTCPACATSARLYAAIVSSSAWHLHLPMRTAA